MTNYQPQTLNEFIIQQQNAFSYAKGINICIHLQKKQPGSNLRLLYEANPVAFLAEQASGLATDGRGNRIMEIVPNGIHQRVALFTGSKNLVQEVESFIKKHD